MIIQPTAEGQFIPPPIEAGDFLSVRLKTVNEQKSKNAQKFLVLLLLSSGARLRELYKMTNNSKFAHL